MMTTLHNILMIMSAPLTVPRCQLTITRRRDIRNYSELSGMMIGTVIDKRIIDFWTMKILTKGTYTETHVFRFIYHNMYWTV